MRKLIIKRQYHIIEHVENSTSNNERIMINDGKVT